MRDGLGGVRNGVGAEAVVVIKSPAQAGLLAAFPNRLDSGRGDIRDEELHGVGADVDDRAAFGMRNAGGEVLGVGVHSFLQTNLLTSLRPDENP